MNWIRHLAVPIGSALALLVWCGLSPIPARAESATYLFRNQPIVFTHLATSNGPTMVGVNDPGLRTLLRDVGAIVTWHSGERYVLITTAEPVVMNFSVGDTRYDVGPLSAQAASAPYVSPNDEVFLPLSELLAGLSLAPKPDGGVTVLQPQLSSIGVQGTGSQAILVARAGEPLHGRVVSDTSDRVVYEFDGVGSTLAHSRNVDAGGIRGLEIATSGSARNPKTIVTVLLNPGSRHDAIRSSSGDFEVAFGGNGGAPPLTASAPSLPASAPQSSSEPRDTTGALATTGEPQDQPTAPNAATVTGVVVVPKPDGAAVNIAVTGNANFEWHRLREPDNRFWIDIQGAQLAGPAREEAQGDPITSLRVRQNDAQTVRVALSFSGANSVSVSPSATGVSISVGSQDPSGDVARSGAGSIGSVVAVNEPQALVTPVPADMYGQSTPAPADWKYGARSSYVPTNPKLIVIDPGHGGSDPGAMRHGVYEKDLALDMARRLRDVLVERGWQVQMTRDSDVDVYAPNDSARDELQARDNLANNAGARLFISVHVNSFINSGPSGTTTYYSKPSDVAFAKVMERNLGGSLGTKDDGAIKSRFWVTLHAAMPAVLIETAFLSNPDDFALLTSPDWRNKVARSIADGVDEYTQNNPVTSNGGQ